MPLALLVIAPLAGCGIAGWDGRMNSLFTPATATSGLVDRSPESLYAAGIEALQQRRFPQAVELFDTLEREHPYSTWATNAKIMAAYGDYMRNRYTESIGTLDRFIQLHPAHRDIAYAHYLRALSFYEQIADSQRDQRGTELAMTALQDVANRFPDTAYARDARLKIDLARDHLAGKEMNIGRFLPAPGLYGAAIGRFRRVVEDYQTTNHVPEALHRLTEIYHALGLTRRRGRPPPCSGHNFPGSPWYQDSYALLRGRPPATVGRPRAPSWNLFGGSAPARTAGGSDVSLAAIRDVVLIERLDLRPSGRALGARHGRDGRRAIPSCSDSLGLALGMRAEAGLVRSGQAQASVAAVFQPPSGHPAHAVLAEQGMEAEEVIVLRRVVQADGRSRAFVNDQPVGVALLKRLAATLVEVQGQHDQVGLADPASHAALLDAFGALDGQRGKVAVAHRAWKQAEGELRAAEEAVAAALRDEEWLRHAVEELGTLSPQEGEEARLSQERQGLQQAERRTEAIAGALSELQPRDRRSANPAAALRNAARALERLPAPNEAAQPALTALAAAQDALAEAEQLLERLASDALPDPRRLEVLEDRLFSLRAAARKHGVAVVDLPQLLGRLHERLAALDAGTGRVAELEAARREARQAYCTAAAALTEARRAAGAGWSGRWPRSCRR
jgi:outer membrane assembly lipoprotein YfiO